MSNKMKTSSSLGIIALALLTFGITGVNHHANNSSDVMKAESVEMVDEDVFSEEDYDRFVFFQNIQEDEQQRLMNDKHQLEQAKIDKNEADRQAEIKLAEEARLEEERLAKVAEENRIKEDERAAQAEREAQTQTTTASNSSSQGSGQTSTQPAAKPAPAPQQPAPQPVIGPNKIGINGVYKSYTNYGKSDRATLQRGVDQGLIVAALTHFNPGDGQTTYFGGHNPGVMSFMASNMYHGAIVTVTDSNGNPYRYKMVDHVNTDNHGGAVFQSIGQSVIEVYTYGSNEESILIQFCNTSNSLMSLWYGVPVN